MPLNPDKLAALDQIYGASQEAAQQIAPEKIAALDKIYTQQSDNSGFSDRLSADYGKRIHQMQGIADQKVSGDISGLEANARMGLKYAQLLPDAVGEGLVSAGGALPEAIKDPIKSGANYVYSSVANSPVGDIGRAAADSYNNFAQSHPVAAGRISSVLDAGNLMAGFVPVKGTSAITAAGDTTAQTGKIATATVGKVASAALPSINEGLSDVAAIARNHNIPLSYDQISDSRALKNVQKVSQELPLSGQAAFREKQMTAFNKALFNTVGIDADRFTPKTMGAAFDKVGGEFDGLTKGKEFNIGGDFIDNLHSAVDEVESTYGKEAASVFQKEAVKVLGDFGNGDTITGDLISRQRSRVNGLARKAADPNIKGALLDLENVIVDGITSKDPAAETALSQAKQRYKNLIVLEPIANKAKGGFISPSLLNQRVSQVYKRAHTVGQSGDIGDLARVGFELLPELGGSDTLQKGAYLAAGAGALANPASIPTVGATLGVNRAFQSGFNRNQAIIDQALHKQAMKLPPAEARKLLQKK